MLLQARVRVACSATKKRPFSRSVYHTLCGHISLKQRSRINLISGFWWFRGFQWMEANVKAGALPNEFSWPLNFLKTLKNKLSKRRKVGNGGASNRR